jgi:hypothetical protein
MSVEERMEWIERGGAISLSRQCELAGVSRASVYRRTIECEQDEEDFIFWQDKSAMSQSAALRV